MAVPVDLPRQACQARSCTCCINTAVCALHDESYLPAWVLHAYTYSLTGVGTACCTCTCWGNGTSASSTAGAAYYYINSIPGTFIDMI